MRASGTKNESTLVIRPAKADDAVVIALLGRVTFSETFGHFFRDPSDLLEYCAKTFGKAKIAAGLQKAENLFWLALVEGLPVGYAKLKLGQESEFVQGEKVGQLQKIYVMQHFLGSGIGKRLQDQLLIKAGELGCQWIWLSVLKENTRAIRFYEKSGFAVAGAHDYRIGKEEFEFSIMKKSLI